MTHNNKDVEKAQKGSETLINFLSQLGDADYYTSMVWEEFFRKIYDAQSERNNTPSLPVSSTEGQEGDQNNKHFEAD